jgi:hypothetical protein
VALAHSPKIATDGMVLCLDAGNTKSYPGSGTTWSDLSGNGNNGSLVNMDGANFNSANGGSLTFDGSNEYVDCGNKQDFIISNGQSFTISCWALYDSSLNVFNGILSKAAVNGTWEYVFGINSVAVVSWLISSNGTNWNPIFGETISFGTWYYYSFGFDYDNQISFLSVNGKPFLTRSHTSVYNTSGESLQIGRIRDPIVNMDGKISNLSFYNRALSASEVKQNFNALRGRFGL